MRQIFVFVLFLSSILFAQYSHNSNLDQLPLSARSFAVGGASVASQEVDAQAIYSNPALLGFYSNYTNLSYGFYPGSDNWINFPESEFKSNAFFAGYRFNNIINKLSVAIGGGYSSKEYKSVYTDAQKAEGVQWGVSLDYYVTLSFGMNIKYLRDENSFSYGAYTDEPECTNNATDWGVHLFVPVRKLVFGDDAGFKMFDYTFKSNYDFSFGYSRRNIEDKDDYVEHVGQHYFIPALTTAGYELDYGISIMLGETYHKLFNVSFTADAEDNLTSDYVNVFEYVIHSVEGDELPNTSINLFDNLVNLHSTNRVLVRKGWRFSFFDTFSYGLGHFIGRNYGDYAKTSGYSVSTRGIFNYLAYRFDDVHYLADILRGIQIDYYNSTVFEDYEYLENTMESLNISVKLPFIFCD